MASLLPLPPRTAPLGFTSSPVSASIDTLLRRCVLRRQMKESTPLV